MNPSTLPIILEADQGETTRLPGNVSQMWKATGATTNGAIDVWVEAVPPGLGPPQHLHAHHDEFFWIVKGTFLVKVADRTLHVSEGPRSFSHGEARMRSRMWEQTPATCSSRRCQEE